MIKHRPSIASVMARWRKRKAKRKGKLFPPPIVTYRERQEHAQLEWNGALYDPPAVPTPEEILIAAERSATIDRLLCEHTSARRERVVRLRYGLGDCESHTLEQVSEQYGVTKECIRQIEAQAFRALRVPWVAPHLGNTYFGRWHGKAHCNLHVPEWKREEQEQRERLAQLAADAERTQAHERAQALADERALAEAEQHRALRVQAREHVEAARTCAFDLDPEHVAAYARELTRLLTAGWR